MHKPHSLAKNQRVVRQAVSGALRKSAVAAVVSLLASSALLTSSNAATSSVARTRTAESPYRSPALGGSVLGEAYAWYFDCEEQIGCAVFHPRRQDGFARFKVVDATGLPVYGQVRDSSGLLGQFCGSTTKPIDVRGAGTVFVHLVAGVCAEGTTSSPTNGVVRAVFARKI